MPGPYDSILQTIGRTPVVRLKRLAPEGVELYAKLEAFNPMGSVKDRLALAVVEAAERSGELRPGQTVIEATSGNTGIGLAMVCAERSYPLVIVMPESASVERRRLMRFLGAKVILTAAADKGTGMVAKARELAEAHGWFLCRQFENEANADVHSRTTAEEILADFDGRRLDYFVTGAGTGGTLRGVSRVLRAKRPETRIMVCEPDNVPMLASGVVQAYRPDGAPAESQGWTPDFVPKLLNDASTTGHIDGIVGIAGAEALRLTREMACKEGIFCGISGGATLAGALKVAETAPRGSSILFMVPDTGERYLSTPLFADIAEAMSDEEQAIAASTPGYRIGVPAPVAAPVAGPDPSPRGIAALDAALRDPDAPVVMFALEWCEFCWALRRFFEKAGIAYRSVDIDSVAYQADDLGGDIRAALRQRLGQPTIPQVFVGGVNVGGCTETLDAFAEGRLQRLLIDQGVAFRSESKFETRELLPKWVHPR
jgi:cysteine synthase A